MIPLSYDVDVIVVGGTLRGVAAAEAAAQAGAKVFLITDRPYLGADVCGTQRLWIKPDAEPKTALGQAIYGESSGAKVTANGYRVVTPMDVKGKLDEALLRAKVDYLYGSYVTEVLRDPKGELAGVVAANRSGRQAIRGKVIIDATERASVARIAGAAFTPYPSGPQKFKRVIVGGKPNPGAKNLGFEYSVRVPKSKKKEAELKSYSVYEYELELPMKDGSWASFVRADQIARDQTYQFGQATYSEKLFQVPPDPVRSRSADDGAWAGAGNIPLSAITPADMNHLYVLGGCAEVSREVATQLLQPLQSLQWGQNVGKQVAEMAVSRSLAPAAELVVAGHGGKATIQADVGDVLTGLRWKPSEGAVRSPARALPVLGRYDTVVVGGGTGGAPAGIGAARAGARTLVIEHLHGLGGVGTLGRIAVYYHGNKAGFTAEVEREITALSDVKFPARKNPYFDIETKMEWLRKEINKAGGEIWYLALGVGSVVQDKRFTGVVVATPDGRGVILANTVVDSTGNSVIPHCAGLETQMIDHEHISVQGTGLPPWHPGENVMNSDWTFAHDDDVMDMWRIHVVAKQKFRGQYDLGQLIDSRVRRRIVGDVMITPMDILNQRVFPDVITVASSDFDNHGFSSHDLFMVYRQQREELRGNIPYRALLPKGYDGILVTGLGISGHGDAMPVLRMQRDIENHSYAAGYASAMAARDRSTVRKIDVKELQRHLVDIGTIPENFIDAEDSYPLGPEVIQVAVERLGRDYSGISQILTQPDVAIPLMREAYAASDQEDVKLRYAHVLGLLYDDTGAGTLMDAVSKEKGWGKGWKFKGCGNYGPTTSPLDNLIIALGRTKDKRALPVLTKKAAQLNDNSELSHFRAVAVAFENIGDSQAAPALARLMKLKKTQGNAFFGIDDVLKRTPPSNMDCTTREVSLRELIVARALYRCGDYEGIGRKTLEAYSNDLRGHYAIHARAVLAENVPK